MPTYYWGIEGTRARVWAGTLQSQAQSWQGGTDTAGTSFPEPPTLSLMDYELGGGRGLVLSPRPLSTQDMAMWACWKLKTTVLQ